MLRYSAYHLILNPSNVCNTRKRIDQPLHEQKPTPGTQLIFTVPAVILVRHVYIVIFVTTATTLRYHHRLHANLLAGLAALLFAGTGVVLRGAADAASSAGAVAADRPALRVGLVELLDRVAVALDVAVARRGSGVDAAFSLLEAGGQCF